jgi:hypothetical protein
VRVLLQWTQDPPQDWTEIDHKDWPSLPDDPVHALNVQGVVFEGYDHYRVGNVTGGCTVTVWNDEGDPPMRWTFYDPAPDAAHGGRVNTRQHAEVYDPDHPLAGTETSGGKVRVRPRFIPPSGARHGRQVPDALHEAHQQVRSEPSWEAWA